MSFGSLVIQNIYATTECAGILMVSEGSRFSSHNALRLIDYSGVKYSFQSLRSETGQSNGAGFADIKELVVLPESIDCPHPSLRSADGIFHTGDLFREVLPGYYVNCGRNDDWIKMANAARCDTR
jgi:acyl-coenzyme A synthetase/AMP-(fatty) acid ligase